MGDTLVAVGDDAVSFAKNSGRQAGVAQVVEHHERTREANEIVVSRSVGNDGAEMGANEHGLAIGGEPIAARVPLEPRGRSGAELVRLALERCRDADDALDFITSALGRDGQRGPDHHAFVLADTHHAWIVETAGRFWAACEVRGGIRTTSNVLSIGVDYTRVGPGTIEGARSLGFARRGEPFDFRRAFAAPMKGWLSGGDERRSCTQKALSSGNAGVVDLCRALRDHGGKRPAAGLRVVAPCAHGSRRQTNGSMISILRPGATRHFFTGTSAPCLSVFKPVPLGSGKVETGGAGDDNLFSRHERLHHIVLEDYELRRRAIEGDRSALGVSESYRFPAQR